MICVLWFWVPTKQPSFNHHAKIVAQCTFPLYFIYIFYMGCLWVTIMAGFLHNTESIQKRASNTCYLLDLIFQRYSSPNCPKIHHIVTCRFIFLHVQTSYCKLLAKAAALHSIKLQWFSLSSNCQTYCTIWFDVFLFTSRLENNTSNGLCAGCGSHVDTRVRISCLHPATCPPMGGNQKTPPNSFPSIQLECSSPPSSL